MRRKNLAYVKKVRSKGREYLYFDTGRNATAIAPGPNHNERKGSHG